MGVFKTFCLHVLFSILYGIASSHKNDNNLPNIVFILTDDQDIEIGGTVPVVKAKQLIGDQGITFSNMFTTSPLCCPSRSSILTGKYVHNHGALNNSLSGNCSSESWQKSSETLAFATYMKKQGYRTFFAGKYLNQYGDQSVGGVKHVPPGWDEWHGLVGNSVYYNYTLSVNGKAEEHGDQYSKDYLTDLIGKRALDFLNSPHWPGDPFFIMLSTPACHAPFTPAPQYQKNFANVSAPRNGSFNYFGKDKHWLLRQVKSPMPNDTYPVIDGVYRNRWRTLLSVDDIVENVVAALKKKNLLDSTYIIFSSDNGYHLGQFSLPQDKRQLYEFDIRVPLMVRGPGIKAGQKRDEIILNIDFAPTFVDLAGLTPPPQMDGASFKNILGGDKNASAGWRTDFVIEHSGEHNVDPGCPKYKNQDMANCFPDCICEDSKNNTYRCVRTISKKLDLMYCEFNDQESFVEVYDHHKDPFQLKNIAKTIDPKILLQMNKRLMELSICNGASCRKVDPLPPGSKPVDIGTKSEVSKYNLDWVTWKERLTKSVHKMEMKSVDVELEIVRGD